MLRFQNSGVVLGLYFACCPLVFAADLPKSPNVVLILTDNHGAWTLGCYGNPEISTPHIDKLAEEGTLLTRAFSCNPVCSPTRATFLTGLVPSQHGVHSFLRGGRLQVGPEARNTLSEFQSVPEILKSKGYRCGLVGKWHLGGNLEPQEGLDDYWITMPHGGTTDFYDAKIIENGQERTEPKYLTEFWTDHAVNFIEQADERPFFLYLAYNGPYALGRLLLEPGHNRHVDRYSSMELTSFPKEKQHPWQFDNLDYFNNPVANRRVAAEVSGVDDGVGRVMQTLRDRGLDQNTVVIFAADQGWAGGHGGFYGMGDHTRPVSATDEMMHIPMIWRHPTGIKAGQRSDLMVSNYDFLPTLINYLGFGDSLAGIPLSPGRDYSKVLRGETLNGWIQEIFYEFEFLRCLRTEHWKLTRRYPHGPDELYDLKHDPQEQDNLYHRGPQGQQARLQARLDEFFQQNALPKYDLLNGGGAQTVLLNPPEEIEPSEVTAKEASSLKDPFDKSSLIRVPQGYAVEKVATSDLVQHPMMAGFDDKGRLYVAESAGLNLRNDDLEKQLPNSIKRLEDTNGDGFFDRSTIFADKMTLPMGACWYRDTLYVASPPHIWKLQDTDDDGVADVREKLPAKFGYNGNAASVHGCFLSPDGRIYWCDGRHGHELVDEQGNVTSTRSGSYIFSCWPDGSDLQIHAGGGMDNPVEVDFSETGDVLGTVNILYSAPRIDCLVHWLHGGAYPHSQRVLGELPRTGDLLGPVHQFGHVGVSGTTRYRSGILDRNFRDNMFVTIFNTGQLVRIDLEQSGSTYRSQQHEFMTCSDPDFHPTDVLEDADGSLLLVDTGGWFRIGCPTSQIAKPDIKGGIYRIKKSGMPSWVDPRGQHLNWEALTNRELILLMMDTRFAVRERAIEECALRGEAILPDLATWASRGDIIIRRNALWACTRMRTPAAQAIVRNSLADADPIVRAIASKSAGVTSDKLAVSQLIARLQDEIPSVRRAALTALGQIGDPVAVGAILQHAEKLADRSEDHALIYALLQINSPDEIKRGLSSSSPATARVALIALDQIAPELLTPPDAMRVIGTKDASAVRAALEILKKHSDWAPSVAEFIDDWLLGEQDLEHSAVTPLISAFATSPELGPILQKGLAAHETDPERYKSVASGIRDSGISSIPSEWLTVWRSAILSRDPEVASLAITGLRGRRHPFSEMLQQIINHPEESETKRLLALEALPRGPLHDNSFIFLTELIERGTPSDSIERAVGLLGQATLSSSQNQEIPRLIFAAGPLELQGFLKLIANISDPNVQRKIAAALINSRSRKTLSLEQVNQVSKAWSTDSKQKLSPLFDELQALESDQLEKLDRLEPLTKFASVSKGKEVFFSEKAKCATCHKIGEIGGKIGPNLSAIGLIRRERDLLEAILFPSKSFAREYEPYSVVTEDGKVVSGLISHETDETVSIQQTTGDPLVFQRKKIESMVPASVSVMPQGLETGLSESELADLVAFLRALNSPPQHAQVDSF